MTTNEADDYLWRTVQEIAADLREADETDPLLAWLGGYYTVPRVPLPEGRLYATDKDVRR